MATYVLDVGTLQTTKGKMTAKMMFLKWINSITYTRENITITPSNFWRLTEKTL